MRPFPYRLPILLLLLFAFVADAQDAPPADDARLLNCNVDAHVPDRPGQADQGGYAFEFQSLRGGTDDDRACTVYRVRNTPGKPPTPLRWTIGDEAIVDKVRLARCREGEDGCPWLAFARYFPGAIDANLSTISYGLNADAYERQADTFMTSVSVRDADVAEADAVLASSVGTELAGTFLDAAGDRYELHLLVKSRFETGEDGGRRLIYEIDDLSGSGALGSGALRIAWDALAGVPELRAALGDGDASVTRPAAAAVAIDRGPDHLYLAIDAADFVLDEAFVLEVYAAAGDEPLASVPMPAYVPRAER
jgi:hypothetical protein